MLKGKKILVGVAGGIAAYKVAHLVRLLIKAGAEVQVVMTPKATEFITPLTLSVLSKHPVHTELVSDGVWNNHVDCSAIGFRRIFGYGNGDIAQSRN